MPSDQELMDMLLGKLHAALAPLHGQEITPAMKARVDQVITQYFDGLERQGWVSKPYPRWQLTEQNNSLRVDFHQGDMRAWMESHKSGAEVTRQ